MDSSVASLVMGATRSQNFSAFLYNDLIDASGQPRPLADIADDALYREIHTADAKAAFQTPYRPAMLDAIAEANPYLLPIARLFYGDSTFFSPGWCHWRQC